MGRFLFHFCKHPYSGYRGASPLPVQLPDVARIAAEEANDVRFLALILLDFGRSKATVGGTRSPV